MIDLNEFPPPHVGATPIAADVETRRFGHPVALFSVAVAVAGVLAAIIGGGIGYTFAAASAAECNPSDSWCELGAALVGLAAGFVTGAITYIAAGTITISQYRPKGRRAGHVVAHIAFPFAFLLVMTALNGLFVALG